MNAIREQLAKLSLYLDDYKNDKDIPYLIENLKSHCKETIEYINLSGISAINDIEIKRNYVSIQFKIQRILGLIDCMNHNLPDIEEFNERIIIFNTRFIKILQAILDYVYNKEKANKQITWLGKQLSTDLLSYLLFIFRITSTYYFLLRSSAYKQKELIESSIFRTQFFINELVLDTYFQLGHALIPIGDFITKFSNLENELRELVGFLQITKDIDKIELKIEETNRIELYIERTCKLCKLIFQNKIFEHIQECSLNLNKGLLIIDSKTDNITHKAMRFFYDIPFVPTLRFPTVENEYKIYHIYYQDEVSNPIKDKLIYREINDYIFGAYSNILPSLKSTPKSSKRKEKMKDKYIMLRNAFEENPELELNKKEIAKKMGLNYSTAHHFFSQVLENKVLYSDDLPNKRSRKYKLNFENFNIEFQKL